MLISFPFFEENVKRKLISFTSAIMLDCILLSQATVQPMGNLQILTLTMLMLELYWTTLKSMEL